MHADALLKTKLRPPLLDNEIIRRARLLDQFDRRRPLRLVVAPAGYGKTTLVADWLRRAQAPSAWVTLDAYDDSLTAFMGYVLAALEALFPDAFPETHAILNSAPMPPPVAIARTLVNEIEALPQRFALVLDNYYLIRDLAVQQIMAELLRFQPGPLELILITRHDPPLPLPALRAHNQLTEIRAQDLRFSPDESEEFVHQVNALHLDDSQMASLDAATEGWAAGLRMATLLMQRAGSTAEAALNVDAGGRFAVEYLTSEIVAHLTPAAQEFLLRTAFMENVCASLCAAVIDGEATAEQCQAHLYSLAENNLFVFPLDSAGVWHRYHYLLRTVLQHRARQTLTAAEIAALHARASRWLAHDGQIDAAIIHAVQSGDVQAVADLARDHRQALFNGGDWAQLETWRRLIPRAMIEQHPQLLVLDAWSFHRSALFAETGRCVDAVAGLLATTPMPADEARLLAGELDAIRTQLFYWAGDVERCAEAGRRVQRELPPEYAYARWAARLFSVGALETISRDEADIALAAGLREGRLQRDAIHEARDLVTAGYLYWMRADMDRMEQSANQAVSLAQGRGALEYVAFGRYLRGCARYQQNDLAGAEQDFATVLDAPYIAHAFVYSQSFIGLAATYQAQGKFEKARATALRGVEAAERADNAVTMARAAGYLAHLSFRQGQPDDALRWLAQPCRILPTTPMPTFHVAPIGRAAILLGLGSDEARAEADELLAQLRAGVERHRNARFLIEVLALQAVSLASRGKQEAALDLLTRAVLLADPGQAVRALADLDFLVGDLLGQLARHSAVRSRIARIRRAAAIPLPAEPAGDHALAGGGPARRGHAPRAAQRYGPDTDLLESLTNRELDVLLLLQERPSNKEIAQRLNITPETVKRHLTNIYLKLNVENRRQALVRARALGILPPA